MIESLPSPLRDPYHPWKASQVDSKTAALLTSSLVSREWRKLSQRASFERVEVVLESHLVE